MYKKGGRMKRLNYLFLCIVVAAAVRYMATAPTKNKEKMLRAQGQQLIEQYRTTHDQSSAKKAQQTINLLKQENPSSATALQQLFDYASKQTTPPQPVVHTKPQASVPHHSATFEDLIHRKELAATTPLQAPQTTVALHRPSMAPGQPHAFSPADIATRDQPFLPTLRQPASVPLTPMPFTPMVPQQLPSHTIPANGSPTPLTAIKPSTGPAPAQQAQKSVPTAQKPDTLKPATKNQPVSPATRGQLASAASDRDLDVKKRVTKQLELLFPTLQKTGVRYETVRTELQKHCAQLSYVTTQLKKAVVPLLLEKYSAVDKIHAMELPLDAIPEELICLRQGIDCFELLYSEKKSTKVRTYFEKIETELIRHIADYTVLLLEQTQKFIAQEGEDKHGQPLATQEEDGGALNHVMLSVLKTISLLDQTRITSLSKSTPSRLKNRIQTEAQELLRQLTCIFTTLENGLMQAPQARTPAELKRLHQREQVFELCWETMSQLLRTFGAKKFDNEPLIAVTDLHISNIDSFKALNEYVEKSRGQIRFKLSQSRLSARA